MTQQRKKELRAGCLAYRESLSEAVYREKSGHIQERIQQLDPVQHAETVHCYISINSRQEIDTKPLLEWLLEEGKTVAAPRSDFETIEMEHIRLTSLDDVEMTPYGIPEPEKGELVPPGAFDLVLVPMVGGDHNCQRIGYGKGFYDRFLKNVTGTKIGLLYEACLSEAPIPTNCYDVPLDMIVTEKRIIRCERQ